MLPPLLLTSCVNVSAPFTQIRNKQVRIELTIKSIIKWVTIEPEIKIVICDGSNFDFSSIIANIFPGKDIECIYFYNNGDAVAKYGKGYGEGEIINHAIEKSIILNEAYFFAKCTSKLWVENFSECLLYWNGSFLSDCDFSYLKKGRLITFKSVDTVFFLANKQYYINNFSTAYTNVRDLEHQWLEHCFKDIIIKNGIINFMLPVAPVIKGISGTTGKENNYSLSNKAYDVMKRLIIRHSRIYKPFIVDDLKYK